VLVGNCAVQLRAMAQVLVRPDLDMEAQRKTTLAVCKLALESIQEIGRMLKGEAESKKRAQAANASITISFTAVQNVLHHEFAAGRVERKPDSPIADPQTILARFANHRLDVAMSSQGVPVQRLNDGSAHIRGKLAPSPCERVS
jgi:hypothetical protein